MLNGRADRREEQPGPEALHDPRGYDLVLRLRDAAGNTGQREDGEPDQEQALVAEPVAGPAAWHQRQSVGERVAGYDPLQAGGRGVQTVSDARKGDVHDRGVKQGHEGPDQDDGDRAPAMPGRG